MTAKVNKNAKRPSGWRDGPTLLVEGTKRSTIIDADGTLRFLPNRIVNDLVDAARLGSRLDLTDIWTRHMAGRYTADEMRELYCLIGYTADGYCAVFPDDEVVESETP